MRILALVPLYERVSTAGAYITTREYVRGLTAAGHTVHVVTTARRSGSPYVADGVKVWPLRDWRRAVNEARPELVISHHNDRATPGILPRLARLPHLLMVHGMSTNRALGSPQLAWFPSKACRRHYTGYRGPELTLPPPIEPGRYRTTPGDLVTLSGATAAKGADVLADVAGRMPGTRFQVVKVLDRDQVPQPSNVEVVDRCDPRRIFARTRLLLMPSQAESYGRVGIEAMLSGIPVIAAPLPGMTEALGDAATYVPRSDPARWVRQIERLSDPVAWAQASAKARAHADSLDVRGNHAAFEAACLELANRPPATPAAAPPALSLPRARAAQIVAWVHFGVPYRCAGSETMLHTLMRALQDSGLDVLVVCSAMPEAPPSWDVEGVQYAAMEPRAARELIRTIRPRAVVTHHDFAARAIDLARTIRSRSVLLVHSDLDVAGRTLARQPDLAVFNTEWVRDSLTGRYPIARRIRSLIVRPPVDPADHRTAGQGRHVTLVNLNQDKGVETWRAAARALPNHPFLGVTGGHGPQLLDAAPTNAQIIPQTADMQGDVWERTRLLMVPSVYESYGMVAVEALASGLPVLAHPTPGLREALGDAAEFIDRDDVAAWVAAIRRLYSDGGPRRDAARAALARSTVLADQAATETKAWAEAVRILARV
ncbi:glycosyltransferase family 4 protein [Streptomyces sp. BH104]|uniref:glycosyltransferase family 4 protein n=1 Tax=Streptomyces sp. BH104 TaxID=3410407 RepID=UPI003BB5E2DD